MIFTSLQLLIAQGFAICVGIDLLLLAVWWVTVGRNRRRRIRRRLAG